MSVSRLVLVSLAVGGLVPQCGRAQTVPAASASLCEPAIHAAETEAHLPKRLLSAIGLVESGRPDPVSGGVRSWPWTVDVQGQAAYFASKPEAVAAVVALRASGVASIDVGCMQVNLMHHPLAFASIDDAFDPGINARYAARFLVQLHAQTHDWPSAAALYHSTTPELAEPYQRRVMAAWGFPLPPYPLPPEQAMAPGAAVPAGRVAVLLPPLRAQDIRVLGLGTGSASLR